MNQENLKQRYSSKDNEELIYALQNPDDYNEATLSIIEEIIQERGGKNKVIKELEEQFAKNQEVEFIIEYVQKQLTLKKHIEVIKAELKPQYIHPDDLNDLLEEVQSEWKQEKEDKKITLKSLFGGIIGAAIGGTIGGIIWGFMMIGSETIFFYLIAGLALISYAFIWLFSRKSNRNVATILLTIISVVYAMLLGQVIYEVYG